MHQSLDNPDVTLGQTKTTQQVPPVLIGHSDVIYTSQIASKVMIALKKLTFYILFIVIMNHLLKFDLFFRMIATYVRKTDAQGMGMAWMSLRGGRSQPKLREGGGDNLFGRLPGLRWIVAKGVGNWGRSIWLRRIGGQNLQDDSVGEVRRKTQESERISAREKYLSDWGGMGGMS